MSDDGFKEMSRRWRGQSDRHPVPTSTAKLKIGIAVLAAIVLGVVLFLFA